MRVAAGNRGFSVRVAAVAAGNHALYTSQLVMGVPSLR